jgi:type VII secretion-associated serine protease mycosin
MRRLTRTAIGTALALGMVAATAAPGAAAAPGPRREQWWFTTWDVQNKLWPVTQGRGVTVAVLDSGVQANLPELSGVVLPGTDATGGGGDGRTDTESGEVAGHGTAMANLIAAQGGNSGFVGVAPEVKILPVVVNSVNTTTDGIKYAVDHGAKVINISRAAPTGQCPTDQQEAVAYAIKRDVVVVAGAGNDGHSSNPSNSPANCAGVLAIGGVDFRFNPFVKTQRQPYVAAAAPATQVGSVLKDGEFHTSEGGTSSATALTSAAVALVRSKFPDMSAREVVQRIIASARDVGPQGRDNQTGYGLIRPSRALAGSVPKNSPNPVFDAYDKWAAANGKDGGSAAAAGQEGTDEASGNNSTLLIATAAAVGIALLIVLFIVLRSRGRRTGPVGPPPGYPHQPPPHPYGGGPQGPPTGFGAPQPPPGQPPRQGPPPGGHPDFRPSQGPPGNFGPPQPRPHDGPPMGGPGE